MQVAVLVMDTLLEEEAAQVLLVLVLLLVQIMEMVV